MTRGHRGWQAAVLVVVLVGMLAACGSDDSKSSAATTAAPAAATTPAATTPAPATTPATTTATNTDSSRATFPATTIPPPDGSEGTTVDLNAARAYCTDKGGQVQTRRAFFNTNGDQAQWIDLDRTTEVCRFQTLLAPDDSRIYVDLVTLYAQVPTLASSAYLAKVPLPAKPTGNPATAGCAALAASSQFGGGASGGGWVNTDDPIDKTVALCVFPDGSFIDEWGIAYYSGGTVRGIDLSKVFRFDAATAPNFFK